MRVIAVHPVEPKPARLEAALAVLRAGGVLAIPTETFYGLAVDASQPEAVSKLNRLKVKGENEPALLLAADRAQVDQVTVDAPPSLTLLAEAFWPGPLTLVLPAASSLPTRVTGGRNTVAVRVPGLALPRILARQLGHPITGVSANLHGVPPLRSAADVAAMFPGGIDLLLDSGATPGGAPSTLIDLTGEHPVLLRNGIVRAAALRNFLPDLKELAGR